MANNVRQYVGARYVPKFADPVAWQSNTAYEALTIVTYNNSSYTSKIPVPASVGNPAQNPTYWVNTGDYNAQVEAYREETVAVQENLTQEISDREEADTALTNQITAETTARENADTEIINSYQPLKTGEWSNKKVIFCGDSYGVITPARTSTWIEYTAQYLGLKTGNWVNLAVSGSAFGNGDFLNQLQNHASTLSQDEINSIDAIVLCGGINDCHANMHPNIDSGSTEFINYCKNTFTNARVYLGFIGNALETLYSNAIFYNTFMSYENLGSKGYTILHGVYAIPHWNNEVFWIGTDYVHPNTYGSNLLGVGISTALISGNYNFVVEQEGNDLIKPATGISSTLPSTLVAINNGIYTIKMPDTILTFTDEQNTNTAVIYELGNRLYFKTPIAVQITAHTAVGTTNTQDVPAEIVFNGTTATLNFRKFISTGFENIQFTRVVIPSFTLSLDCCLIN